MAIFEKPVDGENQVTLRDESDSEDSALLEEEEEEDDDEEDEPDSTQHDYKQQTSVIETIKDQSSESVFNSLENYEQFDARHSSALGCHVPGKGNILHRLVADGDVGTTPHLTKAVEFIVQFRPKLLEEDQFADQDSTPIYQALMSNKFKLVASLFEGLKRSKEKDLPSTRRILGVSADANNSYLHYTLQRRVNEHSNLQSRERAIQSMVSLVDDDILCIQDNQGMTPLHLVVKYEDIGIKSRYSTIKAMIKKSNTSLEKEDNDGCSVFTYHSKTRDLFLKSAEYQRIKSKQTTDNAKPVLRVAEPEERERIMDVGMSNAMDQDAQPRGSGKRPQGKTDAGKSNFKEHLRGNKKGPDTKVSDQSKDPSSPLTTRVKWDAFTQPNQGVRRDELLDGKSPSSLTMSDPHTRLLPDDDESGAQIKRKGTIPHTKKEKKSKEDKEMSRKDPKKLAEISAKIEEVIKLRCMRTRAPRETSRIIYGNNPGGYQVYFDSPCRGEVSQEVIKGGFRKIKFDSILQYVAFPFVTITDSGVKARRGRTDMEWFFDWLRRKGVKRIVKVIVHDNHEPAHSDEVIIKSLDKLHVEELHWMKTDLDPMTIRNVSKDIREVYLSWSGNNTALRAWSEPEGLPRISKLSKIYLDLDQDKNLENNSETKKRIDIFKERLNAQRGPSGDDSSWPLIEVVAISESLGGYRPAKGSTSKAGRGTDKDVPTHKWLKVMDSFAREMSTVWRASVSDWDDEIKKTPQQGEADKRKGLRDPVTLALIDDGVSILDPTLAGKRIEGHTLSFEQLMENDPPTSQRAHAWYESARGHGTIMANMIFRVCPMAKVYAIRMQTLPGVSANSMRAQIDPKSAAAAINAAVDKKVSIISMSWTIDGASLTHEERMELQEAVKRAQNANILLFCSSSDGGHYTEKTYPSCVGRDSLFRIGAATLEGTPFPWAGPESELDFVLPGVDVVKQIGVMPGTGHDLSLEDRLRLMAPETGSSVATALAAGLAALLLACVKMAAMCPREGGSSMVVGPETGLGYFGQDIINKLHVHENIKEMLLSLGGTSSSRVRGNKKFLEVGELSSYLRHDEAIDTREKQWRVREICRKIVPTNLSNV